MTLEVEPERSTTAKDLRLAAKVVREVGIRFGELCEKVSEARHLKGPDRGRVRVAGPTGTAAGMGTDRCALRSFRSRGSEESRTSATGRASHYCHGE